MRLFSVPKGTQVIAIQNGKEWFPQNFEKHITTREHIFDLESVTVDPVGKIGTHRGHVRTVGGSFAEAGTYGFATDNEGKGIFSESRPPDGWTLLVHARDVEVI